MITNFLSDKILPVLCGKGQTITLGGTSYVALSTTTPTAAGGNFTEPVGNGYGRTMLGNYSQSYSQKMGTVSGGTVTNKDIIYFPEATGSWGTCTYFGIYDASTGGNLLAFGELTTPITPSANTIPIVRVGELEISMA